MVGHNPGLEDVIFDLVPDDGSSPLREEVEIKFPTATFAVLELDIAALGRYRRGLRRLVGDDPPARPRSRARPGAGGLPAA